MNTKKVRDYKKAELADLENRLAEAGFSYSTEYSGGEVFDENGEVEETLYAVAYRKEGGKKADFPDLYEIADEADEGGEVLYFYLYEEGE